MSFELTPVKPFRLDLTVWALRRRPDNIIDRWDNGIYRRVMMIQGKPAEVAVTQLHPEGDSTLLVTVAGGRGVAEAEPMVTEALGLLLGIRVDLSQFYEFSRADALLWPLVERFQGVKPPRFPTVYEALVNAIACQQITLAVGIILLNRLTAAYGRPFKSEHGTVHAFPLPQDLAEARPEALRNLGFSHQKSRALIELSQKISDNAINLDELEDRSDDVALKQLRELRGIGRWSADYVLLRGLRRIHIFPVDDVGGRNKLTRMLNLRKPLDYEGAQRVLARWRPFGGLIFFHMLLKGLEEEGMLR
ncbi:MAG: DNA-3-methyladenine glycosylase family protein [Chloroflexota bacterium]